MSNQPNKGSLPPSEDPVRILLALAKRAECAGNGAAARVLASTAELLTAALPEISSAAKRRKPVQA